MTSGRYSITTKALAEEFGVSAKTIRKRATELALGIDFGGRSGFRYSDEDRRRLIESLRPAAPVQPRRRRRAA